MKRWTAEAMTADEALTVARLLLLEGGIETQITIDDARGVNGVLYLTVRARSASSLPNIVDWEEVSEC